MQYRTLGRTGLQVSAVSMGTWKSFDVRGERAIAHISQLVTEALQCGVNLFDTAPMYGEAESVLGQVLRGRREGVIIATKVLAHDRRAARDAIEASFRKLQVTELPPRARHCSSIFLPIQTLTRCFLPLRDWSECRRTRQLRMSQRCHRRCCVGWKR